jgi:hypothetical protein
MVITTVLMNVFSESIKQTIFYLFNLLSKSGTEDRSKVNIMDSSYDDPQVQDDMSEPDVTPRQYFLRERKPVNYKV